ncbi:hypothetical protein [Psychrobium sp. 1_MG-2023]|uniref:hypothetical protein n=1 Tax=Psychrobium sp. 1_MG-2023 TaxID=3062624 RepID=UPI000C339973|nr:hypothetical protein [Psychrobium sp. 1_MG-2023]MDP2562393.1 hypothetical protein [Psychrobium sp. 1_MG-2023]PKF55842.1 hypothetical protein CW748_11945 [Alteromonadales bacterium alter-6D02]
MKNLNKTLIAATVTALLVGCGGGGSGSSSTPGNNTKEYTFDLTVSTTNQCGESQAVPNVEVLLQDANWDVISTHQTDELGQISIVTTQSIINYSVVSPSYNGDNLKDLNIYSYANISSSINAALTLDRAALADNTNCQCVTQDIELAHTSLDELTLAGTSAGTVTAELVDDRTTLFKDVEVCRVADGEWPTHSFFVQGPSGSDELIGRTEITNDFTQPEQGNLQLISFDSAITTGIAATQFDELTTGQLFADNLHFLTTSPELTESVLLFETHSHSDDARFYSQGKNNHVDADSLFGTFQVSSTHSLYAAQHDTLLNLSPEAEMPDIDTGFFTEFNGDGSYDFSAVADYPMVSITSHYRVVDESNNTFVPIRWTFVGETSGTLPTAKSLPDYKSLVNAETKVSSSEVILYKSELANNYAALSTALLKEEKYNSSGPLSNLHQHHIFFSK